MAHTSNGLHLNSCGVMLLHREKGSNPRDIGNSFPHPNNGRTNVHIEYKPSPEAPPAQKSMSYYGSGNGFYFSKKWDDAGVSSSIFLSCLKGGRAVFTTVGTYGKVAR